MAELLQKIGPEELGRRNRKETHDPGDRHDAGHHVYAYWTYNKDGSKHRPIPLGLRSYVNPKKEKLINTAVWNPKAKSWTLLFITIDLDFDRADPKWIHDGVLCWDLLSAHLAVHEPAIHEAITYAVRSTGGRGLSIAISVAPFRLGVEETASTESRLSYLQAMLRAVFNSHGMGADDGARGLHRFMPNFKNAAALVYKNVWRRKWVENARIWVGRELFEALKDHPAVKYRKKKDRLQKFLYPHLTLERKLARLYEHLDSEAGAGKSLCLSVVDICRITGMHSSSFYRSFMKVIKEKGLEWVKVERLLDPDGYRLTYLPTKELTERAFELLSGTALPDPDIKHRIETRASLCDPQEVSDGNRNSWISDAAIKMKHALVEEAVAANAIQSLAEQIPGFKSGRSWSLRNAQKICASIYRNRPRKANSPILRRIPLFLSLAISVAGNAAAAGKYLQTEYAKTATAENLDVGRIPLRGITFHMEGLVDDSATGVPWKSEETPKAGPDLINKSGGDGKEDRACEGFVSLTQTLERSERATTEACKEYFSPVGDLANKGERGED